MNSKLNYCSIPCFDKGNILMDIIYEIGGDRPQGAHIGWC